MFQDLTGDFPVLFKVLRVNEDVIDVYRNDTFRDHVFKDLIHHCLECGRTVSKTEEHHQWLEKPSIGAESRFPLVSLFDPYVVVTPTNVKLGEVAGTLQFVDQFRNKR